MNGIVLTVLSQSVIQPVCMPYNVDGGVVALIHCNATATAIDSTRPMEDVQISRNAIYTRDL